MSGIEIGLYSIMGICVFLISILIIKVIQHQIHPDERRLI